MLYAPNFCCHCGEKIERAARAFGDSSRFCDVCKHDFVPQRALPVVFAALMALVGLCGAGAYLGRGGERPPAAVARPLAPAANAAPTPAAAPPAKAANAQPANDARSRGPAAPDAAAPRERPVPAAADEPAQFCGAETKKGTPCSRRVRGGGRCWQHRGQDALAPPEKLRAAPR